LLKFEVVGTGIKTGRKRRKVYYGANESCVRVRAENDGTEVMEVNAMPADPATDAQLSYADDLGIYIPENAGKDDLSALIALEIDGDYPAEERHREFARFFDVYFSEYTGKRRLFNCIQLELLQEGRQDDLLSWFVFRVYRNMVYGRLDVEIDGPGNDIIKKVADQLLSDKRVIKSVRRYKGEDLIRFGDWDSPNGFSCFGGSKGTLAYKSTRALLSNAVEINTVESMVGSKAANVPMSNKYIAYGSEASNNVNWLAWLVLVLLIWLVW